MRQAVFIALAGIALGGCLEDVEPISSIGNLTGAGAVTLTWMPPTQNADGTPLTDLAGYKIYVGSNAEQYDVREIRLDNPGLTTYVVSNLEPGTYYFAATAFNSTGVESHYSGEIIRNVTP
jgi:hypothetical protein